MKELPPRHSTATTKLSKNGGINTVTVQISKEDKYILIVGFEVNHPEAFQNSVLNLSKDFGHAFFYVTRRSAVSGYDIVDTFFSFGPAGIGQGGKVTTAYNGTRPGDTQYLIKEKVKMFRLRISKAQAEKIKENANQFTTDVNNRKIFYNTSLNDTCAETAKDILSSSGVSTPDGHGTVIGTGNIFIDLTIYNLALVNPYMWFKNFQTHYGRAITWYGETGHVKALPDELRDEEGYKIEIIKPWILVPEQFDPLPKDDLNKIHGDVRG
ncbi:hypothetical protein EGT71_08545 [Atlantibacter subterranea]|uniref:DUF4105 domain-containing protein n=1 Tax=Atlantibacter subterraneus TaxID=255519 RepID=A0A427V3N6_9ENTR|nr:hypothetical protein [Atlantibacter subterranea]MDA3134859.1 hypothetical protein [Atlantibacter subterranea]RSB63093.1 hypothetical protein EGK67_08030 [Atlantibacter subterranea]RSE06040.1 hypothetical protein EGT84_11115 [Atlantibacter subterranea]RSE27344.1 hypothetical protein EGT71_08545 [Atlantibacter subterranea]